MLHNNLKYIDMDIIIDLLKCGYTWPMTWDMWCLCKLICCGWRGSIKKKKKKKTPTRLRAKPFQSDFIRLIRVLWFYFQSQIVYNGQLQIIIQFIAMDECT